MHDRRRRRARVRSTITIASAPSGIGAPVMMRIASPGTDRDASARVPAGELADDAQSHRRVVGRAAVSAARTA